MRFFESLISIFVDPTEEKEVFSPQDLTAHYNHELPYCVLDGVFVAAHYDDIKGVLEGYKYRSEREKASYFCHLLDWLYLWWKKELPISEGFRHLEGNEGSRIESTETLDSSRSSEGQNTGFPPPQEGQTQAVICPVPMHWSRYLIRGFDHVSLLGERLAKKQEIPFQNLLKANYTRRQSKLKKTERIKNREHAFSFRGFEGEIPETVILIDDVISTGSTVNACAKILKDAGVKYVYGFFIASNQ